LRSRFGLPGIEQRLLLALDIGLRLAFEDLQRVERLCPLDQFAVLLRPPGGMAGGQPVVEGIARGLRIGPCSVEFELRLVVRILGGLPLFLQAA